MDNMLLIKLETAKSWFVLAQISIILAGFLFATGGIAWQNSIKFIEMSNEINRELVNTYYSSNFTGFIGNPLMNYMDIQFNMSQVFIENAKVNLDTLNVFFIIGAVFVMISVLFCIFGKHKLNCILKEYQIKQTQQKE